MTEKIRYDNKLLKKCMDRDGFVVDLNAYPKLTRNVRISFTCKCGKKQCKKAFRCIATGGGGFCQQCIAVRKNEKSKKTCFTRYGVENPSHDETILKKIKVANQNKCVEDNLWLNNRSVPNGYWNVHKNIVSYVKWLGHTLGYTNMEDWYKVSQKAFRDNKGCGLLDKFGNSYSEILKTVFPNYEFLPWMFSTVPNGFWQKDDNIRWYLQWLLQKLGHTDTDYHKLSSKDIADNHGKGLLWTSKWKGSVSLLIKTLYDIPNYDEMRKTIQYSRVAICWLEHMESKYGVTIQHADNGGEVNIKGVGKVDGFCTETNTIFEFHGRFYHGDPRMYNPDAINCKVKKTYRDLLQKTMVRYKTIIEKGYNYIHVWEDDWNNGKDISDVSLLQQDTECYKIYAVNNARKLVKYFKKNDKLPPTTHYLSVWLSAYKSMNKTNMECARVIEVEHILDEIPLWRTRRELIIKTLEATKWIHEHKALPLLNAKDNTERLHCVFLYNQKKTGTCNYVKQYLDMHVPNWKDVRGIARMAQIALEKAEVIVRWFQDKGRIPRRHLTNDKTEQQYASWLYEQRKTVISKDTNTLYRCNYYDEVIQYLNKHLPGWREASL